MDEQKFQLVLNGLEKNEKAITALKETVDRGMVGRDNCDFFRRAFNTRLTKVEEVCVAYQATKNALVSENELRDAKDDAIQQAGRRCDGMEERLKAVEKRGQIWYLGWDEVKGSSVWKAAFLSWFVIAAMVAYDRIRVAIIDYGLHTVIVVVGLIILCLVALWIVMNRDATKRILGVQ
jgi:Flp pilus assembly protein TadB